MTQAPKKSQLEAAPTLRDRAETLRARVPDRPVDPILAVIRDGRRLLAACERARTLPGTRDGGRPQAENDATDALVVHLRGPLVESPPSTPIGAIALAKYAVEVQRLLGIELSEEMSHVLDLIARVRLA